MSGKKDHSVKVPRLYKAAAKILEEVIAGGNLKQLVYSKRFFNIKALYALVVEALRHAKALDYIIEKSKILYKEEKFNPYLARILISELLWGKKQLPGNSKPVETVLLYKDKLVKAEKSHGELHFEGQESRKVILPRYVRVNTIQNTVEYVIEYFCAEGWQKMRKKFNSYSLYLENIHSLSDGQFTQDFHIKDLLVFPPKTEFHEHELYKNGSILLQDKASCLSPYLLAPEPGSTVLDMCAAPGMKTSYLAALMKNTGKIYALERDVERYKCLSEMIKISGATCVETLLADSLSISSHDVPGVQYILVDPSCSGSGIVDRIDIDPKRSCDPLRLHKLAGFQIKLLQHALTNFPQAKTIVYSTCSLNTEENEDVVEKVMSSMSNPPQFSLVKKIFPNSWNNRGSDHYKCGKHCLYSRPGDDLTNGFFIAVFEKCNYNSVITEQNSTQEIKSKQSNQVTKDDYHGVVESFKIKSKCKDSNDYTRENDNNLCIMPVAYKNSENGKKSDIQTKDFKSGIHVKELSFDTTVEEVVSKIKKRKRKPCHCNTTELSDKCACSSTININIKKNRNLKEAGDVDNSSLPTDLVETYNSNCRRKKKYNKEY